MSLFVLFESSSLLCSSAVLKARLSRLSLIVAGVPDKTKTKEFQVEYVTYRELHFIPYKIPDETAVLLFYRVSRLVTRDLFAFQPAVVHLQGQETTIQVREGGSSVCFYS